MVSAPPPPLRPEEFADATGVSSHTLARLEAYVALLVKWQRRINLVGGRTLDDVWRRHMLDSAQLHPLLSSPSRLTDPVMLDMGSGAGFPGLVLAIMGECTVHMVESDTRKCAFLFEAIRQTQTNNAHLHNVRMENLAPFPVDVITSRALASVDKLIAMAKPFFGRETICLFPKGQKAEEELTDSVKHRTMDVEKIQSQTDPSGKILKLSNIQPKP